ncbi:MAG TPA: CvpA family protein [Flavobacterium sp.]|nr:CvpA family protein [Flavobacterium sp.]
MNLMDVFLCIGLVFGLVNGLRKGFFVELASLVSLLLGIFVAIKFSYLMKAFLGNHGFSSGKTIEVLAFALTFIVVVVGVSLLAKFFTKMADFAALGLFNKLLGGIFGVLKTVLILSIFLNLLQKVNFDYRFVSKETLDQSKLYQPVQKVSRMIYPSISEWFTVFKSEAYEMKSPEKK